MGNYSKELKNLILLIDEHKTTIGHAAFDLARDTWGHDILRQFSNRAYIIVGEALAQLKKNFYDDLAWKESMMTIQPAYHCYLWSLVYQRKDSITRETSAAIYHELFAAFHKELQDFYVEQSTNGKPVDRRIADAVLMEAQPYLSMYVGHQLERNELANYDE